MKEDRIRYLLEQYVNKKSSKEELNELVELAKEPQYLALIEQFMDERYNSNDVMMKTDVDVDWENIYQKIVAFKPRTAVYKMEKSTSRKIWSWTAAAAVIIALAIGSYLFFQKTEKPEIAKNPTPVIHDIAPGTQGAILTLSNGKQVVLDSTKGNVANENGVAVINKDGSVSYEPVTHNPQPVTVYNTISTPRARQYQLTLQDGTKVWLNAESSIHFPTAFNGKERIVEITGEAYFEVAHDAAKPFIVSVNDMQVEVLGTHFNINSYPDESAMKTTLLEGKVRVTRNGSIIVLKPGQQAAASRNSQLVTLNQDVDLDEVLAWKEGIFFLNNANVQTIMRQVSRWYDVDVVYEGKIPVTKFGGGVSKDQPLSKILATLEQYGLRFEFNGKTLIVKANQQ